MLSLTAEKRTITGKQVKALRAAGKMPVVAYGKKGQLGAYSVSLSEFKKVFKEAGESTVISLHEPEGEHDVLIHEVSHDPVLGDPIHADFYVIEKGQKVQVQIPLEFTGTSMAVKSLGGVLMKVLHELEIEAAPRDLPHSLVVDISSLATFEDQIKASDINLPSGVSLVANPEEIVALVQAPKEEVETEAVPVDLSAIEISEKRGKKEEEVIPEAE